MLTKEEMRRRRDIVINNWELNKDNNSCITSLAKECCVTPETYRKYLREVGIDPKGRVFTYKCNRSFFKVIDSEEKAYWLGFLYADGNICIQENNAYILSLCISKVDEHHLHAFRVALNTDIKIYDKHHINPHDGSNLIASRIDISSKELCFDLIDKGCVPAKSLIKKFPLPSKVPDHLLNHFLRGYFDGNGSIIKSTNGLTLQLASSNLFLEGLMKFLLDKFNIRPKKIYHPKKSKSQEWGTWKCVNDEARIALDYLYKDATIYLERKYQKYVKYCGIKKKLLMKKRGNSEKAKSNDKLTPSGV